MKKQLFHQNWHIAQGVRGPFEALQGPADEGIPVTLPHDAMILEPRDPHCLSGTQTGFYPTKSYTYRKKFQLSGTEGSHATLLEFEGVMQQAMVYCNGDFVGGHPNGYTGFTVDLTPSLREGENELKVLALGQEQASRWYSGMGIYRDVWLWQGGDAFFAPHSLRITTEAIEPGYAVLRVEGFVQNLLPCYRAFSLNIRLLDREGIPQKQEHFQLAAKPGQGTPFHLRLTVDQPGLWSVEHPCLYTCHTVLEEKGVPIDEQQEQFGIRTLRLDARQGLRLNGKTVKLRGACIHHDHGIIGAASLYEAELFRMQQMKAAGFNSVRSAHHPASPALLRACDTVGMLVMDELGDMWNEPKNPHDFAREFSNAWQDQTARMVEKDYNHPCVVLYSTGNELPEIGRLSGASTQGDLAQRLRQLDPTRYVTCGINGFLAVSDDLQHTASPLEKQSRPLWPDLPEARA